MQMTEWSEKPMSDWEKGAHIAVAVAGLWFALKSKDPRVAFLMWAAGHATVAWLARQQVDRLAFP